MQYLEYVIVGIALLIFLAVALVVFVGVVAILSRRRAQKPSAALLYPIPPAERGTGQHHSLLDLVDQHIASEEIARRRRKVSDKLYDFVQDAPVPKA